MNELKYVQLEPGAFLSDIDFQIMTTRQRGVFISLILYLYANGGSLPSTAQAMLKLCNSTKEDFDEDWKAVRHKFQDEKGILKHKRVTSEIEKASDYYKKKRSAGKKGGLARSSTHQATLEATLEAKVSKGKVSKGKVSKEKKEEKKNSHEEKKHTLNEILADACLIGIDDDNATAFYHHYNAQGWAMGNGVAITNIQSALTRWRNNGYKFDRKANQVKTESIEDKLKRSAERMGQ